MNKQWIPRLPAMLLAVLLIGFAAAGQKNNEADVLLQAAAQKVTVEGNLEEAIQLCQQILTEHPDNRPAAAKALMQIGECYEKLGKEEALKAYERVLSEYADQSEQAKLAQVRLAELRKLEPDPDPDPDGLTMTKVDVPLEVQAQSMQTLSPDGNKMACINIDFSVGQNLAVYDLATKKMEDITDFHFEAKSYAAWAPIWSPDSQEVAFKASSLGRPGTQYASELRSVILEGKARTLFRNTDGGEVVPCDWLPDKSAVLVFKGRGRVNYSLGLVSTKDGTFRELYPLERTYSGDDPSMGEASGSADVSPDGRFIAFSDGPPEGSRDIYILSTDGSSKIPLTEHPADDKEPRWSPDGKHIVFLSLRHGSWALWIQAIKDGRPEGLPRMLLDGMQNANLASWTKQGLLSRRSTVIQDVYVMEIDPETHEVLGKPQVVDYRPSGTNVCPVWSPDGKYLAFVSRAVDQRSEGYVVVMPAEGGQARKFRIPTTNFWNMTLNDLRWMPDSSGLGFSHVNNENRRSLFKLDLATGEWKTWPHTHVARIEWRADGKAIYYIKPPGARGEEPELAGARGGEPELLEWELETGEERLVVRGSEIKPAAGFSPRLKASRDYKRIASSGRGIGILDLDTKKTQTIRWEQGSLSNPTWSPDGDYLLAMCTVPKGKDQWEGDLCIVSVEDGQVKNLGLRSTMHPEQMFMLPEWSPDGRKITFATRLWQFETNLIQNVIGETTGKN